VLRSVIPDIVAAMPGKAKRVVRTTALSIETDMKRRMQGPKSGRLYRRGGKIHVASAPGEAPAIDTALLINSIQTTHEGFTSWIDVFADYGGYLEFGTTHMAPRPYMAPSFEANRERFEKDLGKAAFETRGVTGG
jgi:HK97 gp10 family phage protein